VHKGELSCRHAGTARNVTRRQTVGMHHTPPLHSASCVSGSRSSAGSSGSTVSLPAMSGEIVRREAINNAHGAAPSSVSRFGSTDTMFAALLGVKWQQKKRCRCA